ncbi:MAG: hypothetical protein EU539_08405 [Promethearchaeota archaeon]|nr:MAG: hypothetical protein EU539_08405 [Candidatus Lokiarchaeota archaeon]
MSETINKKLMENSKIKIEIENCTKCLECVKTCPHFCYHFNEELQFDEEFEEFCVECGHCVAVCPVGIIQLKCSKPSDVKDISTISKLPSFDSISDIIRVRRSIRRFNDKAVPKELLSKILDTVRYTPTGHNEENIHYTIVQDNLILSKVSEECTKQITNSIRLYEDPQGRESLEKSLPKEDLKKAVENIPLMKRILNEIEKGRELWRSNSQVILIHSPRDSTTLVENCTIAATYIMLLAETLGLGTCSLGFLTAFINQFRTVSKIINIPRKHVVGYSLAIGYPEVKFKRIPSRKSLKVEWK